MALDDLADHLGQGLGVAHVGGVGLAPFAARRDGPVEVAGTRGAVGGGDGQGGVVGGSVDEGDGPAPGREAPGGGGAHAPSPRR